MTLGELVQYAKHAGPVVLAIEALVILDVAFYGGLYFAARAIWEALHR